MKLLDFGNSVLYRACLTAAIAAPLVGNADEYHYQNILVGERAAGLAGAYTAISDSPAGLYYNPAGIVYAAGGNISASVNAYHVGNKTYKRGLSGLSDWARQSSSFVPNFFGVIQPLGKGSIGFSYAVPDSIIEDQDLEFTDTPSGISKYVINFDNRDRTYNIGPSYALEITEGLSIGVTLYTHYRERQWISNQIVTLTSGSYQWTNTYFQTQEYGVKPILGVMWSPMDKISIGASISKTTLLDSDTESQVSIKGASTTALARTSSSTQTKRIHPLSTALGIAYFPTKALLLSLDISANSSTEDALFGNRELTVNFAGGAEYYLSSAWVLRGGLYTNNANTLEVSTGMTGQPEHIDYLGGAGSVSHFMRNSSITLGFNYSMGSGQGQIVGGSNEIQDIDAYSYTTFLSTAYSF